jgi:superfamily II DNA or RNA helicase
MLATICSAGCVVRLPTDGSLNGLEDVLDYCTIVQEATDYQRANTIKLWTRTAVKLEGRSAWALILPRTGFWPAVDRMTLKMMLPEAQPYTEPREYAGNLWASKLVVVNEAKRYMQEYGGVVLQLGTGQGKSKIGSYLVHDLGVKALIVTKNKALCRQAKEDYSRDLGSEPAPKKGPPMPKGCVVVVINSLAKNPSRYFDASIGLVIYDECREYCSEVFSRVFTLCPARYLLGLSADPIRDDGLSKRLLTAVGPLYAPELVNKEFNLTVHLVRYQNPKEYARVIMNDIGAPSLTLTLGQFADDEDRTALVVAVIREAQTRIPANCAVLVMGSRVVDLLRLYAAPFDAPVICQKTPEEERSRIFETSNLIFGTYDILGVGINITRVAAIVYATTRKSRTTQFNGRATRQDSDIDVARFIYDIVDEGLWIRKHLDMRMIDYTKRKAIIVEREPEEFC